MYFYKKWNHHMFTYPKTLQNLEH